MNIKAKPIQHAVVFRAVGIMLFGKRRQIIIQKLFLIPFFQGIGGDLKDFAYVRYFISPFKAA